MSRRLAQQVLHRNRWLQLSLVSYADPKGVKRVSPRFRVFS
jgi:hypothetical protein